MFSAGQTDGDVNNEATPTSSDSSTDQGDVSGGSETQDLSSADSLNTDASEGNTETHVPYERFKTVNEELKEARERADKYSTFEGKEDLVKTYETFDNILAQNPELARKVKDILVVEGERMAAEGVTQTPQPGNPQLTQQLAYGMYLNRYSELARTNEVPDDLNDEMQKFTQQELLAINSDPLNRFDLTTMDKAFKNAQKRMDKILKIDRSRYVKEKQGDKTPASGTKSGTPPAKTEKFNSQQDRASFIANALKHG